MKNYMTSPPSPSIQGEQLFEEGGWMNQEYLPAGKQFENTCLFVPATFSALGKHNLFLDPVNGSMLGHHQRQGLLCLKPCQLAVLISRVTLSIITNNWCDFKHKCPAVAGSDTSGEWKISLFPL